ncbi:MAG: MBL fold metallo-hydrolase RNA specificity domain-containing protein [Burkholderiales bacterium]
MGLQFLGATGTVTGSKTLLRAGDARYLIDCGLFQGYKQLRLRNWAPLPIKPSTLTAVILTHAHIDHSGYLPLLVRDGFKGRIYCSEGTRDLCHIMLPDAGRLQEEEAQYANRRGFSRHKPALPLYTEQDAKRALRQLQVVDFAKQIDAKEVTFSLSPSGHILGASSVCVEHAGKRIVFSGDLGRMEDATMAPPARLHAADYLVVESTYGNRRHDPGDPLVQLASVINAAVERGGMVLIPAFAVGRTQTLLHFIHLLKERGEIRADLPIFLNSPMATQATEVTVRYCERHSEEHRLTRQQITQLGRTAVFVDTPEESRRLNERDGPMVIIAGSGMATGGRVVHHLKAFAPDPRNTILFAGFQAGGTRGGAMVAGANSIKIHGEYVPVRAHVEMIENLSAHADAGEILQWLRGFDAPPKETFINHGEPAAADVLRRDIEESLGWKCRVPEYLEAVALA